MKSFLSTASYYRAHYPAYSQLVAPLLNLIKPQTEYIWTDKHNEIFCNLKIALSEAVRLAFPNLDLDAGLFHVTTDASLTARGGTLSQENKDGHLVPIRFISTRLPESHRKFSIFRLELESLRYVLRIFNPYIQNRKFIVHVDHKPLLYLSSTLNLPAVLHRIAIELSQYNMEIRHIKGENNPSDLFSRIMFEEGTIKFVPDAPYSNVTGITYDDFLDFYVEWQKTQVKAKTDGKPKKAIQSIDENFEIFVADIIPKYVSQYLLNK